MELVFGASTYIIYPFYKYIFYAVVLSHYSNVTTSKMFKFLIFDSTSLQQKQIKNNSFNWIEILPDKSATKSGPSII